MPVIIFQGTDDIMVCAKMSSWIELVKGNQDMQSKVCRKDEVEMLSLFRSEFSNLNTALGSGMQACVFSVSMMWK